MSGIRTNAAAGMLGISASTLRSWERRYGFPRPDRSPGGHRQYALAEVESLRVTFAETRDASSAVSLALERGQGPSSWARLAAAFGCFDELAADRLLEESLMLRSFERTIEEVLLIAVQAHEDPEHATPEYEFASRYATGWLSGLRRLAPLPTRPHGILIFDATSSGEIDALHAQAIEVVLRRAGRRTLSLGAATDSTRLGCALRALAPGALILTGRQASLDAIGRFVHAVRTVMPDVVVFEYRSVVPDTDASTVSRLGDAPIAAARRLLARLG